MGKAGRGTGTLLHSPIASYGIHPATVALHAKGDNLLQHSSFHVVSCAVLRWGLYNPGQPGCALLCALYCSGKEGQTGKGCHVCTMAAAGLGVVP